MRAAVTKRSGGLWVGALPALLALLSVVVLVTGTWLAWDASKRSGRESATRDLDSAAGTVATALQGQAREYTRVVGAWALAPEVQEALRRGAGPGARIADVPLATLARSVGSPSVFLTDLSGRAVATYPAQPELYGRDFSFRDWFRGTRAAGGPYVSTAYRSAAVGNPAVVAVATPVSDAGARLGYVTVLWQLDALRAFVATYAEQTGFGLTVTDQAGQSLTGLPDVDARGEPLPTPISPRTQRVLAGETLRESGGASLLVARPVTDLGWTVTATEPLSQALTPTRTFQEGLLQTAGLGVVLLLVLTAVAVRTARDRARLRQAVADESARVQALCGTSPVGVIEGLPDGTVLEVNEQMARMLGYTRDEVLRMPASALAHPDSAPAITAAVSALSAGQSRAYTVPRTYRAKDGTPVPTQVDVTAVTTAAGVVTRVLAFVTDLRPQQAAEAAASRAQERLRQLFDGSVTGAALLRRSGEVVAVNASLAAVCGSSAEVLVGGDIGQLLDEPADRKRVHAHLADRTRPLDAELLVLRPDGQRVWTRWRLDVGGQEDEVLLQVQDVSERVAAEQALADIRLHDPLTGLGNRRRLLSLTAERFSGPRPASVCLLVLDLDGFAALNDRAGWEVGDDLLRTVAEDLVRTLHPEDSVARVGDDQFAVLLARDDGLAHARSLADRLGTSVRRQLKVEGASLPVSASIGVARVEPSRDPHLSAALLLRRAEAAMNRARAAGGDRHDVWDSELQERFESRVALEREVRDALDHGRVEVVYQPVVDVDNELVIGAEALVRLTAADGRRLQTAGAVVAAEHAGLAEVLGDTVLDLAVGCAAQWPAHMTVAVNISARELTGRDLRSRVELALERYQLDPARLVLEITETSILSAGPTALAELERLRKRGVRVAVDDFGTAYATLQNLTTLPVDVLKVDASFTAGLPDRKVHSAVVRGVAAMAYDMGVPCVVEGVESEAQLRAITGMGVHAQGWFWGQPQSAAAFLLSCVPTPRTDASDRPGR